MNMPKASLNFDNLTNVRFIYRQIYQESKPFHRLIFRQVLRFIKEAAFPGSWRAVFCRGSRCKVMTAKNNAVEVVKTVGLFLAAGVCEIGGGWLVWKWRKDDWHWGFAILGE
jgi:hypothetical protein